LSEIFEKNEASLPQRGARVTLDGQNFELFSANRVPIGLSQIIVDIGAHNQLILKTILPFIFAIWKSVQCQSTANYYGKILLNLNPFDI